MPLRLKFSTNVPMCICAAQAVNGYHIKASDGLIGHVLVI